MEPLRQLTRHHPVRLWAVLVGACGILTVLVLEATHTAWGDCSDPLHESANTLAGWVLVGLGVAIPLVVAVASRRRSLLVLAVSVAALQVAVWWWAITSPFSDCGSV